MISLPRQKRMISLPRQENGYNDKNGRRTEKTLNDTERNSVNRAAGEDRHFGRRVIMSVFGVVVCGISVGIFKCAMLGMDPFQSFMSGLNAVFPISFGTLYVIANASLLLFALLFDRRKIGLATVINLTLLGYIAQFSETLLKGWFPELSLAGQLLMLLAGVVIMCFASAFYFTADLGVSPYDAVSLIISERKRSIPFKFWRIISDVTSVALGCGLCLLAGWSFGKVGTVIGIGTIITAFFMGPLITFFNEHAAQPFLNGRGKV